MKLFFAVVISAAAIPAFGQQFNCDCTQIIGSCEASIRWEPTGSGVSQGAKLRFTSTAPICSKVSYYIDSTPYFNILSRGNTDEDTVFGTKPFTAETLSEIKCQVCKQMAAVRPEGGERGPKPAASEASISPFAGTWTGTERNILGARNPVTATFEIRGSQVTGTWQSGTNPTTRLSGRAGDRQVTISLPGGASNMPIRLIDDVTAEYSFAFGSGRLTKQ